MNESNIDTLPSYDIELINLLDYNNETKNIILSNLKNYKKLKIFYCNNCHLDKLPNLPNSLVYLYCGYNNLIKLPNLPNSLKILFCCYNNLIELDNLPNSLIILGCSYNNLTELPDLPNTLEDLYCHNNNLTKLPDLPYILTYFDFANNSLHLTYRDLKIKTINQTNTKNKAIKKMKLLDRNLLLEHSAVISMNPKRIQRLLDNLEIDFFDSSFDNLTF